MIGEDVRMYQGVTLGALSLKDARKKKIKKASHDRKPCDTLC